jgi:arylsulfatase A
LNGRAVRGDKGHTTTLGTHVPMIASWPGTAAKGRVCDDLIDFTDVLPTLAAAAGAELPKGVTLDGRSFLPQVRGEAGRPRDAIFCHYQPESGKRDIKVRYAQDKRWKLYRDGRLFDLAADDLEKSPVKGTSPDADAARKKLQAVLDRMERDVPYKK